MKSYIKIFSLKLAVFCYLFSVNSNAQILDDIVRSILVNSNFQKVEVVEDHRYGAGRILLKGSVDTYYDKLKLYESVIRIPGVNRSIKPGCCG